MWKAKFDEIIEGFGGQLDFQADIDSARVLNDLLDGSIQDALKQQMSKKISGREVFIFGCGPSLERNLACLRDLHLLNESKTIIAADGATSLFIQARIPVDIIVSDLDGSVPDIIQASQMGAIIVIHAHGDNVKLIKKFVHSLRNCMGTCQTQPFGWLHNWGGFTDGDRCVFLAEHFLARRIMLFGFDFGESVGKYSKPSFKHSMPATQIKKQKLHVAFQLIEFLKANTDTRIINCTFLTEREILDIITA
ncbi:MAG: 6-hydroxymethylpterin diphosphokinase MptE-like protein [Candidatus Helarchaeota archaeon]